MMTPAVTLQSNPLDKLLKERFRISTGFHPGQRDIIEQLIQGKRLLVIQRTGWGKSPCYQVASLYYPYLTLVFSPLKALMRDQCQRCNENYGIGAAIVSSEYSQEENKSTLMQAINGYYKVLFIAPERLDNADWQNAVYQMRISMIVVDEAHCISTWGHDFRPHYQRIVSLLTALPRNTPVLALTATANRRVEDDVLQQIGSEAQIIRGTMQRPNLYLNVEYLLGNQEKLAYLSELLPYFSGTGIIYTATRHDAEMVATFLQQQGIEAEYYHAGREEDVRQDIEHKLMSNQYKVVCSTNALGMGIDKADIRFIIHYQFPGSPIHYYQEIGRAGRDGKVAWCILLYDPADLSIQEHFIRTAKPESNCYESILSLLRIKPQGRDDLMHSTGYAQSVVQNVLADLEERHLIERNLKKRTYSSVPGLWQPDFSSFDIVREQKLSELRHIQEYAQLKSCYMEFLTTYLGDQSSYNCRTRGNCRESNLPHIRLSNGMLNATTHFLEEEFLPRIEKRGTQRHPIHEAGWSLSYHGTTRTGKLVRASKYENAGPFAQSLISRAVDVIHTRYPLKEINGIVSVPPTRSGVLVETFARQIADVLSMEYRSVLTKVRLTQEQKSLSNRVRKADNVKDAFIVHFPEQVVGRTLLLIDDIYDSGYMLREVGQTLMQAGAKVVYPLTITRTAHSDDQ
jgi:ATP-dependent DNA helicase RecQ